MGYSINRLEDAPIVIFTRDPHDNPMPDLLNVIQDIRALLDAQPEPVFLVFDIPEMSLDVGDMLMAARISARGQGAYLHHPNIRENVYVTRNPMMKMGIRSLTSATFGWVRLACFDTYEEAMAYCYDRLGLPAIDPDG